MSPPERAPNVLDVLAGVPERTERHYPDLDGQHFLFFAQLATVRRMVDVFYARALKPFAWTLTEYQVASVLRGREGERGTTPQDLNQIVQLTSAGMTRTLDRLEAAGHVVREPNPDDRRSVLVRLTAQGRRSAEDVTRALAEGYAAVLGDASAKDVVRHNANLREVLELLAAEID